MALARVTRAALAIAPRHVSLLTVRWTGDDVTVPTYAKTTDEPMDTKRARLLYQSRKRGIRENGLLLGTFAKKYLPDFNEEQLVLYDRLINLPSNDWEIYYWAVGTKPVPEQFDNQIMKLLQQHARNDDRENRFSLPDLH